MLQIISGKFFTSKDRYIHNGKGVLFSNAIWVAPIETSIGSIEPVDYHGDIGTYVFSYKNQIEKDTSSPFHLVRAGDAEILEQFKLLCTFGLQSYFSEFREQVVRVCKPVLNKKSSFFPISKFIPSFTEVEKRLTKENAENFSSIIDKVISLDRASYKKIISALKSISDSIDSFEYNIDLSYSILIYGLESLAKDFQGYHPSWADWEERNRRELDEILQSIDNEQSQRIKETLLKDRHLKIQQNFVTFIERNIDDIFFINQKKETKLHLRKSHLKRAIKNAYSMRSKFVHELSPIQHQLRCHDLVAKGYLFTFSGEPYLTYLGLFNLANHVINNLIISLPSVEKEKFDWRDDLPGRIEIEFDSKYWLWRTENLPKKDANKILSTLFQEAESRSSITDLSRLMVEIEKILPQIKKSKQEVWIMIYWLYTNIFPESRPESKIESMLNSHSTLLKDISMANLAIRTFLGIEISWELTKCVQVYKKYSDERFRKNALNLPAVTEAAALCSIANLANSISAKEEYYWVINTAICELSSIPLMQNYLRDCMSNCESINTGEMFRWQH
ncbi:MAG: hypothetical protein ACL93V_05590 [Candidatus Electrothrix sp. YB6]